MWRLCAFLSLLAPGAGVEPGTEGDLAPRQYTEDQLDAFACASAPRPDMPPSHAAAALRSETVRTDGAVLLKGLLEPERLRNIRRGRGRFAVPAGKRRLVQEGCWEMSDLTGLLARRTAIRQALSSVECWTSTRRTTSTVAHRRNRWGRL